MTAAPPLTDRTALALHRRRAFRKRNTPLFLHQAALRDIRLRLADVQREFGRVAIVTGSPDFWKSAFPQAEICCDEEPIRFQHQEYDLVLHAMALHWSDDPVGQLIQCRRVLRPDGLLLCVFFGEDTLIELRTSLLQAEVEIVGGASPRVAPMTSLSDCGALLQRARFALPVADRVALSVSYPSIWTLMHDLRHMGESNALHSRLRVPPHRNLFAVAEENYRKQFTDNKGKLRATFDLMFLTGWAPAESQPKPLRPGSATKRLSDALNTVEQMFESDDR